MLNSTSNRVCQCCKSPITGREDKRFCNDYCRIDYHNQRYKDTQAVVRNVNNQLNKNRKILNLLLTEERVRNVSRTLLNELGYNFNFLTQMIDSEQGPQFLCYDLGLIMHDENEFEIIRKSVASVSSRIKLKKVA